MHSLGWATISDKGSPFAEAVQLGLRKSAKAAFQIFCSYGLPLLVVALSAWTMVLSWHVPQHCFHRTKLLCDYMSILAAQVLCEPCNAYNLQGLE